MSLLKSIFSLFGVEKKPRLYFPAPIVYQSNFYQVSAATMFVYGNITTDADVIFELENWCVKPEVGTTIVMEGNYAAYAHRITANTPIAFKFPVVVGPYVRIAFRKPNGVPSFQIDGTLVLGDRELVISLIGEEHLGLSRHGQS